MANPLTFPALGTTWWIEIFDEVDDKRRNQLLELVTTLVHSIEVRFSRFRSDSLISILNTNRTIASDDTDLFTLVTLGKTLYTDTNGVFNCLLGEHLEARGYDASYSFTPTTAPATFPNPLTDIAIKNDTIALQAGKIDLGGYGKGWAIDQAANLLAREGITEFLINAGGDMYGTSEGGQPIVVYLEHPHTPNTQIGSTTLFHEGFAASSSSKRQWKHEGTIFTHIVDTQSNSNIFPELVTDGIFIKAKTAVMADAFATTGLLVTPATLLELAKVHQLALAFFNHTTSSLTSNPAFTNNQDNVL